MGYYDPSSWIASDDSIVVSIEAKLILKKSAWSAGRTTRGKSFLPKNSLELQVLIEDTGEELRLVEWQGDRQGKIYIDLNQNVDVYRSGHFRCSYHQNPNGCAIPPPHHIHFPTIKYRKLGYGQTSYAHPIMGDQDCNYILALQSFCDQINIFLDKVNIPLWSW
jgi:hypothetical protein